MTDQEIVKKVIRTRRLDKTVIEEAARINEMRLNMVQAFECNDKESFGKALDTLVEYASEMTGIAAGQQVIVNEIKSMIFGPLMLNNAIKRVLRD